MRTRSCCKIESSIMYTSNFTQLKNFCTRSIQIFSQHRNSTSIPDSSTNSFDKFFKNKSKIEIGSRIVIALYSYKANDKNELSFKKGDKLIVIGDHLPGWSMACKLRSPQLCGYIPLNYTVPDLTDKVWYCGDASKKEIERLLLNGPIERGTFLIRRNIHQPG